MRKQMRSTARTPGTEDHNVDGNAHRSVEGLRREI
jgi:hypothetical protein